LKKLPIILLFFTHAAIAQVDSLTHVPDSLFASVNFKLDSIEGSFNKQVDSLKQSYGKTKSKLSLLKNGYQKRIDSLNNLKLSTEKYIGKMDSLNNEIANVQQKTAAKIDSLKGKLNAKIKSLNLPPQADDKISKLTASVDKLSLPSMDADIASKTGLGNINAAIPGLPVGVLNTDGLPSVDIPSTTTELPTVTTPGVNVQGNLDQVNQVTGKAGEIQQQVKEGVTAEQVGQAIETKASELDQIKAIQDQAMPGMSEGLPTEMPTSGGEAKEQLVALAQTTAIDHFAGKEAVIQQAMDKMSKYKEKYSSATSIKDLPDKRPNPMKEKPFIERVVPGITLQFQSNQDFLMDLNLSAGYRFTDHITAGVGWNQRWAYTIDAKEFNAEARIYGVRSYGEYNFKKGFALRTDVECMNTLVTENPNAISDVGHREWVWTVFSGLKQEYRISKTLRGNVQVMYNLFDPHHKSPYTNRLNVRMGFEFVLKKKAKK
jgi:hypothetical protein